MQLTPPPWDTPSAYLIKERPDAPVMFLSPAVLQATARRFMDGFPGLVTYAVKANPHPTVLENLVSAGIQAFDVASPDEMRAVRAAYPQAALHYNNPVRSDAEIAAGRAHGVASWSVDCAEEWAHLRTLPRGTEIAVRFKLPVSGASYDFGDKFGATPDLAAVLLRQVAEAGFSPALTFHPGTQCEDARAWASYITEAARIARTAGVTLKRLNIGGGFPVARNPDPIALEDMFDTIASATRNAFGAGGPELVCEPGRAMVGDAMVLATRVKSVRTDGTVYLNDGIYGALADFKDSGLTRRLVALSATGTARTACATPRVVFGPTCDSLDRLPDGLMLPGDVQVGDYVLFGGMGAYSVGLSTAFNGYGVRDVVITLGLSGL